MNKNTIVLIMVLLSMLFMNSCAVPVSVSVPIVDDPTEIVLTPTNTLISTLTSTETTTPTPTETLTPTITYTPTVTFTPTITPTPTEIPPVEWDLDPYIEIIVDEEWRGVNIKARILVDSSLDNLIESIEFKDGVLAEVTARTIWLVWYSQNKSTHWQAAKPFEVNEFMELWSLAQRTGNYSYWRQVQIEDIWVNDLDDGNGYVQEPRIFWPMYEGETPYGVLGMEQFTFVLLDNPEVQNMICSYRNPKDYCIGSGSSYYRGDILVYHSYALDPQFWGFEDYFNVLDSIAYSIGTAPTWLIQNKGSDIDFDLPASGPYNKIKTGVTALILVD